MIIKCNKCPLHLYLHTVSLQMEVELPVCPEFLTGIFAVDDVANSELCTKQEKLPYYMHREFYFYASWLFSEVLETDYHSQAQVTSNNSSASPKTGDCR